MRNSSLLIATLLMLDVKSSWSDAVYSVNAVAYVNLSVGPGLSLIANPLFPLDARIDAIFPARPDLPNGAAIHVDRGSNLVTASYDAALKRWLPEEAAQIELLPGEGFFFENPLKSAVTLTFVGEVANGLLTNQIPQGFSVRSSIVPQEGSLDLLGFPAEPGDEVFRFDSRAQRYVSYFFDDFDRRWRPEVPNIQVGEAFFVYKQNTTDWIRNFSLVGALPAPMTFIMTGAAP